MTSITYRRIILRLSRPDWIITPSGVKIYITGLIVLLTAAVAGTSLDFPMLVSLLVWLATLPVVVPGIIRLRQQNRRRIRQGIAPAGQELCFLYAVGWIAILLSSLADFLWV